MTAENSTVATAPHRFVVRRDDEDPRYWLAQWSDDERVHTFARSLAEIEELARDALALWLDGEVEQVHVTLDVELTPDLHDGIVELSRLRGELAMLCRPRSFVASASSRVTWTSRRCQQFGERLGPRGLIRSQAGRLWIIDGNLTARVE